MSQSTTRFVTSYSTQGTSVLELFQIMRGAVAIFVILSLINVYNPWYIWSHELGCHITLHHMRTSKIRLFLTVPNIIPCASVICTHHSYFRRHYHAVPVNAVTPAVSRTLTPTAQRYPRPRTQLVTPQPRHPLIPGKWREDYGPL